MKERITKDFIYRTEENRYGKSKDYEICSTDNKINRFVRIQKIYGYNAEYGGYVATPYWRISCYNGLRQIASISKPYKEVMDIGREYIKTGKIKTSKYTRKG